MSKIISIGTLKGGVGKTMTTFNLAGILAEMNYKVLCIDVDPQGNLTSTLGVNRDNRELVGVETIFSESAYVDFNEIVIKNPIPELPTLDLLPSTVLLHKSELFMALTPARELKLQYFMMDNKKALDQYDYILIDTNSSMGYLNQNAFIVSDKIIMPTTADLSDLDGIHLFCSHWDSLREKLRLKDNIAAVVVTKNDKRVGLDRSFVHHIKNTEDNEDIAELLLDTIIPSNIILKEAAINCKPINIYNKNCVGYTAYKDLVDELFNKGVFGPKINNCTKLVNNSGCSMTFIKTLTSKERETFEQMSPTDQEKCERYCIQNTNSNVFEYIDLINKVDPISQNIIEEVDIEQKTETKNTEFQKESVKIHIGESLQKVQDVMSNSFTEKEAGKNISVYLSADAIKVLYDYKKKNKIKNRSSIFENLIMTILK